MIRIGSNQRRSISASRATSASATSMLPHCSADMTQRVALCGIAAISAANWSRNRASRAAGFMPSQVPGCASHRAFGSAITEAGNSEWFSQPGLRG